MTGQDVIDLIGLDRATSISSVDKNLTESKSIVLNQVGEFGVDAVYFNTDENENSFPAVFLKKVESFDSKTLEKIADAQKKIWNYKKVLFFYVYSETEIRIYNCSEKPLIVTQNDFNYEKELQNIEIKVYKFSDNKQLEELNRLFSRIAIDTGIIWTLEEAQFIRDRINLQRRVDKYLVASLINTAQLLEQQGLAVNLIHKLILRSLFLLYLEDRGATDENLYSKIKNGTKSYFEILDDVNATKKLFEVLEGHFNGNVFTVGEDEKISVEQLQLIKKCFISGNDNIPQIKLFDDWRLFDFSIIQIELLSEIYENFLFKTDPELKKRTGTYYTPPSLVEFILNEKLPTGKDEKNYSIKILDPSCGSGIFLVESFKRLVKRYENQHKEKLTDFVKLKKLLTDNIFGIELHPQAIKVAAFSLYLALLDNLSPKTIWQNKNHRLPNLINNPNDKSLSAEGKNLFCRDTILENKEIENIEFDLVVGNPPFGTTDLSESIRNYCSKYGFGKEMVLPFLHKATMFAPNGEIVLIFNTKVLTNTSGTYQNFRKWLFNECCVEKVYNFSVLRNAKQNFGGQLFGDATGPISIVFYRKGIPQNLSDKIAYYAPKTYIKSNIVEGLNIDFTDLKYLPLEECQKPDTKIWKVAMWGGIKDWQLVLKLLETEKNVGAYLRENKIDYSVGLQPLNNSTEKPIVDNEISKLSFIRPEKIERYYTNKSNFSTINALLKNKETIESYLEYYSVDKVYDLPPINVFRRITGKNLFSGPMLLTKEGLKNNQLCFSYIDSAVAYNSTVLGFKTGNKEILKFLSSILNSELATYFLLLISNSWGVERERIKPNEIYEFPITNDIELFKDLVKLHDAIEVKIKNALSYIDFNSIEKEINEKVFNLYNIKSGEKQLIKDFVEFSVDLFLKQEKSKALYPVLLEQTIEYGKLISDELNNFLDGQDLFTNATVYCINRFSPLMMIKLSFAIEQNTVVISEDFVDEELKKMDKYLWEENASNIYFRKKLNYKKENDIYIIRPNQRRFWSQSMAIEDASELILEILNEN
ncbi:HsdM family class I SAM-dependent methyltransferase [Solitalea canadensis]|uniref:site-specific DNA-methyltransferase (adenine-specific) n=1 Tax=Solitalea canadensis (strain ATCC 29591 / DSM 3403 / JCM 21819 / LMG 8368 / NBRC 15130 / NCIMB 12057 / USAM 9D) TaxID=929556 RepID=H8KLX2_SOLCM|nr:N-6 DNA methylase [Solitalea canadensis]AFD08700.1 type I restriction-modification system methyltransferase subunit [Solitalea canadensis DSM 3403]